MKNIKKSKYTNTILNVLFIGSLSLVMVFTRSFMGLYFLGFRLGELVVAFGLILILFNLFRFNSIEFKNTLQAINKHKKVKIFNDIGNSDITHLVNFYYIKKIFKRFFTRKPDVGVLIFNS